MPSFSIITPSLQRDSLLHCCESVNAQTFTGWQHIVILDGPPCRADLLNAITHPQRTIICLGARSGNFGNTPRWLGWKLAVNDYCIYLDDDNHLAHGEALAGIAMRLAELPDWAVFPITRFGDRFFDPNPGCCHVDSANMVIKREIAQWPDIPDYTADGIFCEQLKSRRPFAAFPDAPPIIVVPVQSKGE